MDTSLRIFALHSFDGFENRVAGRCDIIDHEHFAALAQMPIDSFARAKLMNAKPPAAMKRSESRGPPFNPAAGSTSATAASA
jgi:hypothetical protein